MTRHQRLAFPSSTAVLVGVLLSLAAPSARAELVPRTDDLAVANVGDDDRAPLSCPQLAVGADGGTVVVWSEGHGRFVPRGRVLARGIEPDGARGPRIELSEDISPDAGIVALASGGFLVHWSPRDAQQAPRRTAFLVVDAAGRPAPGSRFSIDGTAARVASLGDRVAVLTKHDAPDALVLRLFDPQGNDGAEPRRVGSATLAYALASDGAGRVVVAWVERGRQLLLKMQVFDGGGEPTTEPIGVARLPRPQFQAIRLDVAAGAGRFVVGWTPERPLGVNLRVFTIDGELAGSPRLPPAGRDRRLLSSLAVGPRGVVVVWDQLRGRLLAEVDARYALFEWDPDDAPLQDEPLAANQSDAEACGRLATDGAGNWAGAWREGPRIEARTFAEP